MRTLGKFLIVFFAVLSAVSCRHTGIVNDAPVKLVKPVDSVPVLKGTDLREAFQEVLNCYLIQIVNDTILVVQDQVNDDNQYHFKAYSAKTLDYLGAFVRNGRGPGEMLHPYVIRSNSSEKYLIVNDISTEQVCLVDVEESIKTSKTVLYRSDVMPNMDLIRFPLSDDEQFVIRMENGEKVFQTAANDGGVLKTFDLYKGHGDERYVTYLSSMIVHNNQTKTVAEVMLLLPQINFLETESGRAYSVAVSKNYRNWQSVIECRQPMEMTEYYSAAASAPHYILAAYRALRIFGSAGNRDGTHIHIFDWNGNFLHDISVAENIVNITYDNGTGFLYGIDRAEDRVVRYDLSGLI